MGAGIFLPLLPALGSSFLLSDCLFKIVMKAFALSDYSLFCHIWPLSLGGLFFFDRRQRLSVSRIKEN